MNNSSVFLQLVIDLQRLATGNYDSSILDYHIPEYIFTNISEKSQNIDVNKLIFYMIATLNDPTLLNPIRERILIFISRDAMKQLITNELLQLTTWNSLDWCVIRALLLDGNNSDNNNSNRSTVNNPLMSNILTECFAQLSSVLKTFQNIKSLDEWKEVEYEQSLLDNILFVLHTAMTQPEYLALLRDALLGNKSAPMFLELATILSKWTTPTTHKINEQIPLAHSMALYSWTKEMHETVCHLVMILTQKVSKSVIVALFPLKVVLSYIPSAWTASMQLLIWRLVACHLDVYYTIITTNTVATTTTTTTNSGEIKVIRAGVFQHKSSTANPSVKSKNKMSVPLNTKTKGTTVNTVSKKVRDPLVCPLELLCNQGAIYQIVHSLLHRDSRVRETSLNMLRLCQQISALEVKFSTLLVLSMLEQPVVVLLECIQSGVSTVDHHKNSMLWPEENIRHYAKDTLEGTSTHLRDSTELRSILLRTIHTTEACYSVRMSALVCLLCLAATHTDILRLYFGIIYTQPLKQQQNFPQRPISHALRPMLEQFFSSGEHAAVCALLRLWMERSSSSRHTDLSHNVSDRSHVYDLTGRHARRRQLHTGEARGARGGEHSIAAGDKIKTTMSAAGEVEEEDYMAKLRDGPTVQVRAGELCVNMVCPSLVCIQAHSLPLYDLLKASSIPPLQPPSIVTPADPVVEESSRDSLMVELSGSYEAWQEVLSDMVDTVLLQATLSQQLSVCTLLAMLDIAQQYAMHRLHKAYMARLIGMVTPDTLAQVFPFVVRLHHHNKLDANTVCALVHWELLQACLSCFEEYVAEKQRLLPLHIGESSTLGVVGDRKYTRIIEDCLLTLLHELLRSPYCS